MATTEVELEILVDIRDAVRDLNKLESEAQNASDSMSRAFGAIKAAAAAAVAIFAGREVIQFFDEGIGAAIKQQNAMAQLEQQLRLTGEASDQALDQFKAFADEMERTSKFGDDVVLNQVAVAKSFGITNDQAQKLVKAAIELSAATGETLDGAVQQLGKTFTGVQAKTPALRIALQGISTEGLKAGEALDVVLKRFGGSSLAEIETFSGALLQARNGFDNFRESLGAVVVENPAVIEVFKALRDGFGALESFVQRNSDDIEKSLTSFSKGLLSASADILESIDALVVGFDGLGDINFSSVFEGIGAAAKNTAASLLLVARGFTQLKLTAQGVGDFFSGDVFAKTRPEIDTLNAQLKTLDTQIDKLIGKQIAPVDAAKVAETNTQIGAFSKHLRDMIAGLDRVREKGPAATQNTKALGDGANQSADDVKKLREELAKLEKTIADNSRTEIQKVVAVRDEELASIDRLERAGALASKRAGELRIVVEETTIKKLEDLRKTADDKAIVDAEKAAKDAQARIRAIAAEPIKFAISKLEIQPADISDLTADLTAASVGILSKVLEGAAGAKQLIAQGAGAFADAFVPGIGQAVSSIVSKLADGPDATKKFIREFIDAVPDIMVAVGESMPAVVEAFVDSMINEGGAERIGVAVVKGMAGEGFFKSAGKQLGLDAGSAFNSANIAQTIAGGFAVGVAALDTFPPKLHAGADRIQAAGEAFGLQVAQIDDNIRRGIAEGAPALKTSIVEAFAEGGQVVAVQFNAFIASLATAGQSFAGFGQSLVENLGILFEQFEIDQPPWLNQMTGAISAFQTTPPWIQALVDAANSLSGGSQGGSTGGFIGQTAKRLGLPGAAEGGVIPEGFPNDSFLLRAQSRERVLSAEQNTDLTRGLNALAAATEGGGNTGMLALLAQISAKLDRPMTAVASAELNGASFADIILSMSRQNQRLVA